MQEYSIILEKGDGDELWGQLTINDALLTVSANSRDGIVAEIRSLIKDFVENGDLPFMSNAEIDELNFKFAWHLYGLFSEFKWVNISAVARATGTNPSLLRQYAAGTKFPSEATTRRIEAALRNLGQQLASVNIAEPA